MGIKADVYSSGLSVASCHGDKDTALSALCLHT